MFLIFNIYFLYQAIFSQQQSSLVHLARPKPSDREHVICGLTRCPGVAVQVRTLAKNIRNVGTETIKCMHKIWHNLLYFILNAINLFICINLKFVITVELKKLQAEGFGVYVDKNRMEEDKIFPSKNCFAAFVKKDIIDLPDKFLEIFV